MRLSRPLLQVDLGAIAANWRALARLARPAECAAVVKADAYGLGADEVAPRLAAAGARTFFVATPEEGRRLRRRLGPGPSVFAMNGAGESEFAELEAREVRPVLSSPGQIREAARFAASRGRRLSCGIQLESGMNRLGVAESDEACVTAAAGDLDVALLMSHLGSADEPEHPINERQREAFDAALGRLGERFPDARRSLAATAGILLGERYRYDLVRPGIGLYGGLPFREALPVVTLEVPVLRVQEVRSGETVGYNRTWRASRNSRIATLPIGYADGVLRSLGRDGGMGEVRIGGRTAPFAGRVSMDLVTADVTDLPEVREGDAAELIGRHRGIDEAAEAAGTIGHEILTSLRGRRLDRRYVDGGQAG